MHGKTVGGVLAGLTVALTLGSAPAAVAAFEGTAGEIDVVSEDGIHLRDSWVETDWSSLRDEAHDAVDRWWDSDEVLDGLAAEWDLSWLAGASGADWEGHPDLVKPVDGVAPEFVTEPAHAPQLPTTGTPDPAPAPPTASGLEAAPASFGAAPFTTPAEAGREDAAAPAERHAPVERPTRRPLTESYLTQLRPTADQASATTALTATTGAGRIDWRAVLALGSLGAVAAIGIIGIPSAAPRFRLGKPPAGDPSTA